MTTAELFEKLKGMPEEVAKIQAECKTQEEVYEALKALGLTDSKEQFLAAVKENIIASGAVSKEELDSALAVGGAFLFEPLACCEMANCQIKCAGSID